MFQSALKRLEHLTADIDVDDLACPFLFHPGKTLSKAKRKNARSAFLSLSFLVILAPLDFESVSVFSSRSLFTIACGGKGGKKRMTRASFSFFFHAYPQSLYLSSRTSVLRLSFQESHESVEN